jgi:hypothetical protein
VTEEAGLSNLIENSFKAIEQEKEAIKNAAALGKDDEEAALEDAIFDYDNDSMTKDEDFVDFEHFK